MNAAKIDCLNNYPDLRRKELKISEDIFSLIKVSSEPNDWIELKKITFIQYEPESTFWKNEVRNKLMVLTEKIMTSLICLYAALKTENIYPINNSDLYSVSILKRKNFVEELFNIFDALTWIEYIVFSQKSKNFFLEKNMYNVDLKNEFRNVYVKKNIPKNRDFNTFRNYMGKISKLRNLIIHQENMKNDDQNKLSTCVSFGDEGTWSFSLTNIYWYDLNLQENIDQHRRKKNNNANTVNIYEILDFMIEIISFRMLKIPIWKDYKNFNY